MFVTTLRGYGPATGGQQFTLGSQFDFTDGFGNTQGNILPGQIKRAGGLADGGQTIFILVSLDQDSGGIDAATINGQNTFGG